MSQYWLIALSRLDGDIHVEPSFTGWSFTQSTNPVKSKAHPKSIGVFFVHKERIDMAVLNLVQPGAKLNQVILAVDLTIAGVAESIIEVLKMMGYDPEYRHVSYRDGAHVLAVLKDEQCDAPVDDDYLLDEWQSLASRINSDAVLLWRGVSR